jgi:rhomboid family protein
VIPLRDLDRRTGAPIATALLIFINVAVWIYVLTLVDQRLAMEAFYHRWAFDPAVQLGVFAGGQVTSDMVLPFITHQFLHAGWLHIAGNMLFLWVFGAAVELRIGAVAFLIFYLFAGCIAAIAQGLVESSVPGSTHLVGASGGISGVLGAYLTLRPTARVRALVPVGLFVTPMTLPAVLILGEWLLLQLIAAFNVLRLVGEDTAHVAYFGHLGGFACGVAVVALLKLERRLRGARVRQDVVALQR